LRRRRELPPRASLCERATLPFVIPSERRSRLSFRAPLLSMHTPNRKDLGSAFSRSWRRVLLGPPQTPRLNPLRLGVKIRSQQSRRGEVQIARLATLARNDGGATLARMTAGLRSLRMTSVTTRQSGIEDPSWSRSRGSFRELTTGTGCVLRQSYPLQHYFLTANPPPAPPLPAIVPLPPRLSRPRTDRSSPARLHRGRRSRAAARAAPRR
jgi:hypothetical protein